MKPILGVEYNIDSYVSSVVRNPNPIFRGICIEIDDEFCDIKVTEYNITDTYKRHQIIQGIRVFRLNSIVDRLNKGYKYVLERIDKE